MYTVETLGYKTYVDTTGARRGFAEIGKLAAGSFGSIPEIKPVFKLPDVKSAAEKSAGNGSAAELASSLAPLASMRFPALDAIAGQVSRLAPLFEKMAGALILSVRRADAATRLPLTKIAMEKARDYIAAKFDDLPPRAQKVAAAVDFALSGLQFAQKLTGQVRSVMSALTSLDTKIGREAGRAVGPMQTFGMVGEKAVKSVEGATNRATGAVKGFGVQLLAALGVFGLTYKGVEFFKGAIKSASDYNETVNSTQSILEGNAAAAQKLSDSLAKSFGLARRDTLEMAASFGGLLKGFNITGDKLDSTIDQLVRRAADLSSNRNVGLEEVGKSILVQLSGEQSDFMKRMGVDTTEATLKQYALANGISKAGAEMTNQEKVLARLGIMMEKTSFAQGDLAATIDAPANAYRRFLGQVENLKVELGTAFLPVVAKVVAAFNELATAGAGGFDGKSAGMTSFIASLNEAVDTAAIFTRNWDLAFQIIAIKAGAMANNFAETLRSAVGKTLFALTEGFKGLLDPDILLGRKQKRVAIPKHLQPQFMDADKLIAPLAQEMGDREFKRQGGAPLKPPAPIAKAPPKPVDDAAVKAANDAAEKMKQFVKGFTDKARTPFEEYKDIIKLGKDAFAQGKITKEQFGRLDQYASKESGLNKVENPETRFAGAAQTGTSDFVSSLNRALYGTAPKAEDKLQRLGEQEVTELRGIREDLKRQAKDPAPAVKPNGARG